MLRNLIAQWRARRLQNGGADSSSFSKIWLQRKLNRQQREFERAFRKNGISILLSHDYESMIEQEAFAKVKLPR